MGEDSNYRNMNQPMKDWFFSEDKKFHKIFNYKERLVLEQTLVTFFQNQTSLTSLLNQIL